MAPEPLVSVIVPVFNAARFLAEAITSVLRQDHRPLEIVVVDDGSTDGSAAVASGRAEAHAEVRLIRRPRNAGPADARNAALAGARGDLIGFLDADDRMAARRLSFQVDYLRRRPEIDVVIGSEEVQLEPGVTPPAWVRRPPETWPRHYPMSMLVRRPVFDRVGAFDERLRVGSDADWLYRAAAAGATIALLDRVMVHRRIHGENLTYRTDELRRTILRSLRGCIVRRRSGA